MTREEKKEIIDSLTEQINNTPHFYLTDISNLNAVDTSNIRRKCFNEKIKLVVVKKTLLTKAIENSNKNIEEIKNSLKNSTSIMFCETANVPAKLIQEFRKKSDKPVLKAAYVEESVYIGDNQLSLLVNIKSKNELIADIIALLQSPMKTVVSQLQSGKHIIGGLVKTLSERE